MENKIKIQISIFWNRKNIAGFYLFIYLFIHYLVIDLFIYSYIH